MVKGLMAYLMVDRCAVMVDRWTLLINFGYTWKDCFKVVTCTRVFLAVNKSLHLLVAILVSCPVG
jgi:hypothetical protein